MQVSDCGCYRIRIEMDKQQAAGGAARSSPGSGAAKADEGLLGPFSMTALTLVLVLMFAAFANAAVGTAGGDSNAAESEGAATTGSAVAISATAEPARLHVSAIIDQYPNGTIFAVTLRQGEVVAAIKQNGTRLARVSSSGQAIDHSIVPLWQIVSLQPDNSVLPTPASSP